MCLLNLYKSLRMKKNILTVVLIFIAGYGFAQGDIGQAAWVSSPVKVDGLATEWSMPLRYYHSDAKLFFAFANDDKNLYLCFQTVDNVQQRKIMRSGMKVALSSKGNGKHKVSISFPMAPKTDTDPKENNVADKTTQFSGRQDSFFAARTQMEVKGFLTKEGIIPANDSSGINAALNIDNSKRLTYEVAIPLKEFLGAGYSTEDIEKSISLDMEIKGSSSSGHDGGNGGYSGRGGGSGRQGRGGAGMGGGGSRMGGGGNRSGRENSNSTSTTPEEISNVITPAKSSMKTKFVLALGK